MNSQEPTATGAGCWRANTCRCHGAAHVEKGPGLQGRCAADSVGNTPSGGAGAGAGTGPHYPAFSPRWRWPGEGEHLGEARGVGRRQGSTYPEVHSAGLCGEVVPRGAGPQQRQAELVTTSGLSSVSCSIRRPPSKTVCLVKQPKQPTKKIKLSDHTGGDHRPHHVTCAFVWLRNLFCYGFCYGIYFVLVKSTCSKGAVALFSSAQSRGRKQARTLVRPPPAAIPRGFPACKPEILNPSLSQPLTPTILLPVFVNLSPVGPHISGLMQYLSLCDWLVTLSAVFFRLIHVVASVRTSF